jgi:hypothetical protein
MAEIKILQITPTIFLKNQEDKLKQLLRLELANPALQALPALLRVKGRTTAAEYQMGIPPLGKSDYEIFIDELSQAQEVEFILECAGTTVDRVNRIIHPPRHWVVHVVQSSHLDAGYTDLSSRVLNQHSQFLEEALAYADASDDFPRDARFRILIEQAWSLGQFLKQASPSQAAKMIERLRQGRFELTALFGNLTTELCGHETLIRALYLSAGLKRRYGISITSAEHNDIPGFSWGLTRILAEAGVKLFCPGLPLYYDWGGHGLQSFWDQEAIFGHAGPGAFWWQTATNQRVLFWCNNSGCGGDSHPELPGLAGQLQKWDESGYPYTVMRWPVIGAGRDNSPYRLEYAQTIRDWNERWAYPHLVCSTNALFYNDFIQQVPADLPTWRGELPGQDYPVGALSTARPTAINRVNHAAAPSAEKLASFASLAAGQPYPDEVLFEAYERILWHDEHSWGFEFPAGPAAEAAEGEKALHASLAAGYLHEVINKAMAAIADRVQLEGEGFHLVVFNTLGVERSGLVRAPMREMDNLGSTIYADHERGCLRGVLLGNRWHENPPPGLVEGKFDLVDVSTGQPVTFQMIEIEAGDPVPYAAQRTGLGRGTQRLGMFEDPAGIRRDLCFVAQDVPAHGYKTYRLSAWTDSSRDLHEAARIAGRVLIGKKASLNGQGNGEIWIENEFYRLRLGQDGRIAIFDRIAGRELVDEECPHGFGELVVRGPRLEQESRFEQTSLRKVLDGPVCRALEVQGRIEGHPRVVQRFSLVAGLPQVGVEVRILKDATPLLDVQIAFPFQVEQPVFRYEGVLNFLNPIRDFLPGAYSDALAVQNWVSLQDQAGKGSVTWSSLDAPVVGLGGLWPGYVSPAHRAALGPESVHPPLKEADLARGWIYSKIFYNNLGTNFSVSQVCDVLFRYVITTQAGRMPDDQAALFGWQAVTPFEQIFTVRPIHPNGNLPPARSFLQVDNPRVSILAFKKAEEGQGYFLRLWNTSWQDEQVAVTFPGRKLAQACLANIIEKDQNPLEIGKEAEISLSIPAGELCSLRVVFTPLDADERGRRG